MLFTGNISFYHLDALAKVKEFFFPEYLIVGKWPEKKFEFI
jgi:hypothetical protein